MQEKEDKKGFLQSFTGKFKKISLDDEPDELMLKYGDIKLKDPEAGKDRAVFTPPVPASFFQKTGTSHPQRLETGRKLA